MNRLLVIMMLVVFVAGLGACASSGGSGGEDGNGDHPAGYAAPPSDSLLAKVQLNSSDIVVRKIMGEPDDANAYMTGKSWIPFYYGSDTRRTDWIYSGKGRVVFSNSRYTGALKVIKVLYNPNEP
ncbi:MAG: hypothetical protein JRE70_18600 [Deltaproteobacteria bacterium]|nr:hypothetical protein [Deltaproteobacteria bacterium]